MPVREEDTIIVGRDGKKIVKPRKTPYTWNGLKDASNDPAQIEAWFDKWPNALVGINTGMSGLVCLDIDMGGDDSTGEVHDGWGNLEELDLIDDLPPTFEYQTPRGGTHMIYVDPQTAPLGPTQNHEMPNGVKVNDVDRRGGASYFLWHGDEVPASRDVFGAPPAWLLTPARESSTGAESSFGGSNAEWLAKCVEGAADVEVSEALEVMASKQGSITHQEMIEFQRYLIGRAADHLAPGIPETLAAFREIYTDFPAEQGKDWGREFDISLAGAIKKYGAFATGPRDIPTYDHVPALLAHGEEFVALMQSLPSEVSTASLLQHVKKVIHAALEKGSEPIEAAALAWWSSAARAVGGIRESASAEEATANLWNTTWTVFIHGLEDQEATAPEAIVETQAVRLLSNRERSTLARWWGDEFMEAIAATHSIVTEPYYRMNRWMILSMLFGSHAHLQFEDAGRVPLNFYGMNLGPTKTGKSDAVKIILDIADSFFSLDSTDNPDIGGDATAAALQQALILRDGKASLFHTDEADMILRQWADQKGEFRGMKQRVTDYWGGRVGAMQRATMKEMSGKSAKTSLSVLLTGVQEKVAEAIEPGDWETGFLNRFVVASGFYKETTPEQNRRRPVRGGGTAAVARASSAAHVKSWADRFRQTINMHFPEDTVIDIADDVLDRHIETDRKLREIAGKQLHKERVFATIGQGRMELTILKCAALVAASDKRRRIEMPDYLIALEQAEEWVANAIWLVNETDLTAWDRVVAKMASQVEHHGGRMEMTRLHRLTGFGDFQNIKRVLAELEARGIGETVKDPIGGTEVFQLTKTKGGEQ